MATLWDIVTGNSSLPVQSGNTFWDHLNSQQGGGSITLQIFNDIEVELDMCNYDIELEADYDIELDPNEFDVELEPEDYEVEIC